MRLFCALLGLAGCARQAPPTVVTGDPPALVACPDKPNCVSSQADPADSVHYIEPLPLAWPADEALTHLESVVADEPRTEVVDRGPGWLHVTYTTALMRFVDDVAFLVDAEAGVVHVRSASRVGYGDLGVNRKRVERLRERLLSE